MEKVLSFIVQRELMILLFLMTVLSASAYDATITVDQVSYGINKSTLQAEVEGPVDKSVEIENLTIPGKVSYDGKEYTVSSIKSSAFYNCRNLTGSLTLPEKLTRINFYTFNGCSGLTGDLTIPNGVTRIDYNAFDGCSGFNGSLTLPEGLNSIYENAFSSCSGLTGDLNLPDGLTSIGNRAFFDCSSFNGNLIIPKSVTTISYAAFDNCSNIRSVWSQNPTPHNISYNAFDRVGKDTPLYVPAESVDNYKAANGWKYFNSIIPFTFSITIDGIVYEIIIGAEDIVRVIDGSGASGEVKIPSVVEIAGKKYHVAKICDSTFKGNADITRLVIPATVDKVGEEAFAGCAKLIEVMVQDSDKMLTFGNKVFAGSPIETVYYGRNSTGAPFAGNENLTELTIGVKVSVLAAGEFADCPNIKEVTVSA